MDAPIGAAGNATPLITEAVDDANRVAVAGGQMGEGQRATGADRANGKRDELSLVESGNVDLGMETGRLLLLLRRSPAQEAGLKSFLQAVHTPGNAQFHQWLKPEEFGRRFGVEDSDLAAITAWLQSHGLEVKGIHTGRGMVEFSGTAGQLSEAFHARLERSTENGETRLGVVSELSIPAALAPAIAGIAPLNDMHPQPQLKVLGSAAYNVKTHAVTPGWTYPTLGGGASYAVSPGDFAMQYDIKPVYASGINGAGQSIAIVSASNIDLSLVQAYQTLFSLSASLPAVIVDGEDPGQNSAATEAYLDVEMAEGIAPGATILLYTSGGTALTNGLAQAALRAVDDDQAGLISVSYGECEMQLGQSGNAFWTALWEQAAAQGQSVFVAAGDGGSAGCDNFSAQSAAYAGVGVNGMASTAYNVAVGGTDFYYSQYGNGNSAIATQLAGFWSATSTAPAVSLGKAVPEQAWNDFLGYNLADGGTPSTLAMQNMVAGGGGASSAAVAANGGNAGNAKPGWQAGTGVPADGVRDLPDVALFAGNGFNDSFYPICANPGDCSNTTSSGAVAITAVGGTSASAPAMAAIQALVNQSAKSWTGQANFIYYPLAARQNSVFRDVAVSGNNVLCYPGTANCIAGASGSQASGYWEESGYKAGTGYDLATGLGSVDVANLIKYWSSIGFKPTTTTLNLSPATLVHGKATTVTATVSPSSGSGTPGGSIALAANDGLPAYAGLGAFALTAGSVYATVDNLPGGTYQVTADYSGDATYAASKSSPVTVTVTPETGSLQATGWAWNPFDLNLYALSSGITVPYGAQILLDAQVLSGNASLANQATPATGTVTFTDKTGTSTTTSTQPMNAQGMAEWATGIFSPGSHVVSEAYSGDPSYNSISAASAATFTVIQGSTTLSAIPMETSVAAGSSVDVDVQLATGYLAFSGTLPTGQVTVTLGGKTASAVLQPFGPQGSTSLEAVVTFTGVPAGILPLTASYSGDGNWQASAANGGTVLAVSSKLTPTVTLTTSLANPTASQTVTLTAKVSGPSGKPVPTGTVVFLSDNQTLSYAAVLSGGTATVSLPAFAAANGVNLFTANYQGDTNYTAASSAAVSVTVAEPDFSLTTTTSVLAIAPGRSTQATLVLTPLNGFTGTVALSYGTATAISGAVSNPSIVLTAAVTCATTLSVPGSMTPGTYAVTLTATGGGHVHTAQILVEVAATASPGFSPAPGTYSAGQTVTLTDTTAGAAIYYTTNGATPTTSSTRYTSPISVQATETIEAMATAPGYLPSGVAQGTYTISQSTASPVFSPPAGSYATAQTVSITDSTAGATIYYTTNGTTPTTSSTVYKGTITVSQTETLEAVAVSKNNAASAVASATYTIKAPAAAPTFSPPGGTYTSAQSVTISDTTAGATIYYTTNGTTPTTSSTQYTGAIAVAASETIEAVAISSGTTVSAVASAAYVINASVALPVFSPAAGTYTSAQSVTLSDTTAGTTIYYTTNGSTPSKSSTKYTGAISVTASETIEAIAVTSKAQSAVATATYTISPLAATPTFSPAGGTYTATQSVTISDTTTGATIYYTTNGATPSASSTKYTGAISVASTETLKAIAAASGHTQSAVATATYTITPPAATPVFSPVAGKYSSTQSVKITDTTAGATIYYTTNGTTPTTSSTKYTGAITVSQTETLKAIAVASGYSQSALATAAYTISLTAATPTISPAAGTYTSAQSVTIADSTPGATISYTTNGSAPTTSSAKYTGAINVAASQTIEAIAVAQGYAQSATASAGYMILPPAATPAFSPAAGSFKAAQQVTITDTTAGSTIYYTTNGTQPTTSSALYAGAITVSATETLEAMATAAGHSESQVATATYTINLPAAAAPKFSLVAGTYSSAQTVTISSTTPNATIYYTTNGAVPTTSSTKYTAAIKVAATETVEAIAIAAGYSQSPITAAAYTIKPSGAASAKLGHTAQ